MNYVYDIELRYTVGKGYEVHKINFRQSFYNDFNKMFSTGYIDLTKTYNTPNGKVDIRVSNTLPKEEMENYIKKLKEKYNITYNVGKLFNPTGMFYVKDKPEENEIIRIFPMEGNILDEEVNIGVISIDTNQIDEKDFYRYVESLPSLEEIYNSYIGMIDKNPSSKSIIVVDEEIS